MKSIRCRTALALLASAALSLTAVAGASTPAQALARTMSVPDCARGTGWTCVEIAGQAQQDPKWCGPAATATVLSQYAGWWLRSVPSQTSIAAAEGTNSTGFTPPGSVQAYLNKTLGGYVFDLNTGVTNNELWNRVVRFETSPRDNTFIILVHSNKIWYKSAPPLYMHYLVIFGFNPRWSGNGGHPAYLVWDPEPVSQGGGVHHLSASDFQTVAVAGHVISAGW